MSKDSESARRNSMTLNLSSVVEFAPKDKPLLSFGVITDIQYADCDDRPAWYNPEKNRYYRGSLNQIRKAFDHWTNDEKQYSFVLQLGDIIDGLNRSLNSHEALEKTFVIFESFPELPTFHVLGNHELYNFKRDEIAKLFRKPLMEDKKNLIQRPAVDFGSPYRTEDGMLYYSFKPKKGFKVIALDCFDVSAIGYDEGTGAYQEAARILYKYHNHDDYDLWDTDGPLTGLERRFQSQNGALSQNQLNWLDSQLQTSDEENEKIIVFGHVGIHPDSVDHSCLLWNYDEVIKIFGRHKCVIAYFCGHTHASGYAVDKNGIHYVAFQGVIETNPDSSAFASVTIYNDHIKIEGHGMEKSRVLSLRKRSKSEPSICTMSDAELLLQNLEQLAMNTVQPFAVSSPSLPLLSR